RYTKATSSYTIRGIIEDVYGFRSKANSYGTSITISNLGPIAKVVASPSRQRTGGTFSFGNSPQNIGSTPGDSFLLINQSNTSPSDGVVMRVRTRASVLGTGVGYAQLWRKENEKLRCIYSDPITLSTTQINEF